MKRYSLLILSLLLLVLTAQGKVKLPAMMGSHMVLQQNSQVNLWGWADGKKVTVTTSWDKRTYKTTTREDGSWMVKVNTPRGSYEPHSITIGDGPSVTLSDVLIGEVWICSGQSNMEMTLRGYPSQPVNHSLQTLLNAGEYSNRIRFITVPKTKEAIVRNDFEGGQWNVPSPETVLECSATAYYFAMQLTRSLRVPVGLVISSWAGSAIEAWMSEDAMKQVSGVDVAAAKSEKKYVSLRLECLYNSMLWPVKDFTARGFLWYQGEANVNNWQHYAAMMTAMVKQWRELWHNPDMPFYYVQIAPYFYENSRGTNAALLREAQMKAQKSIPHSGLISTMDIGSEFCIHPSTKEVVGLRLAALALTGTYGVGRLPATGPVMSKVEYNDSKAIVTFDNASTGLVPAFTQLEGFEIAGSDKIFHSAEAKVVKRTNAVEVWSEAVPNPIAVRYAFRNYMGNLTLQNTFGQSAFPFRTDSWDDVK